MRLGLAPIANGLWLASGTVDRARFRWALSHPAAAQAARLREILAASEQSEFGRQHGFARISSVAEFQACVPLADYEDFAPAITRMAAGEGGILTTALVKLFEPSSGSTAAAKLIPYTAALQREFQAGLAAWIGVQMVVGERNRGKFGALLHGMQTLLAHDHLTWFAAVDQDGDHFGNDLLNFVRAAQHVTEMSDMGSGDTKVMVLGNRASRHRPLGFLRAEQEELCNHLLMDALTYAATTSNHPLPLQYLTTTDSLPDFHSGYKFFSRATAQAVFAQEPPLMQMSESAAFRHACEAVMTVEAYLSGATLAAVNRRTYDEQPISLFASYNRASLAADMILWPCKRLGVPGHFVAQWLANHLPTLLLGTLAPQGTDELIAIRDLVLAGYGLDSATTKPAPFTRPRFV